jgi:hypothetical protein
MIRHVALFHFDDGVTADAIDALDRELGRLPSLIPTIASFATGRNIGITSGAWDYGVVAEFASQEDYQTYAQDPDHLDIIANVVKPLITDAARIQFEV